MNTDTKNKDGRISLNVKVLKDKRKKLGLSQEKVAEHCLNQGLCVSLSSIKRAELGENVLYRTATNLADFYAIPIENLLQDRTTSKLESPNPLLVSNRNPLLTITISTNFQTI